MAGRSSGSKGLRTAAKVFGVLAGALGILGGLTCGAGLVVPDSGGANDYSGPLFFGFFMLVVAGTAGVTALALLALSLAVQPIPPGAPASWRIAQAFLGLAGTVPLLYIALALLAMAGLLRFPLFVRSDPMLVLGGSVALALVGLAIRATSRPR